MVRDHDGQQLAYDYFEEEPGRRSAAKQQKRGTPDQAASRLAFPFEGALAVSIIVLIAATAVRFRCA